MRYLTKSRFGLALQCLTKLYYTKKEHEYADASLDNPFLEALAQGGFQVGELAKFHFCKDPIAEKITVETLDYDQSVNETTERLARSGTVIIAEAAFRYESMFIRSDIIVKKGNSIDLYEVKSISSDKGEDEEDFVNSKGEQKVSSKWVSYLYDIAYQKYVISKALANQNMKITAYLIMLDKNKPATVNGLNQKFKLFKRDDQRPRIKVEQGLTSDKLGDIILKIVCVDDVIQRIWDEFPVQTDYKENFKFEDFVKLCTEIYSQDQRIFTPLKKECRDCQFHLPPDELGNLKSGFYECWKHGTNYSDELLKKDLVLDLWGGGGGSRSIIQELIDKKKYLMESIDETDIIRKTDKGDHIGLTTDQRRLEQINRVKQGTLTSYFDRQGFLEEMRSWKYPLHMIDFETSMTALPFHKGRHPYEGIAFQFSHHVMEKNGSIRHAGQFISFEPGVFPNYEFIRELKRQLEKDNGSIFRYHYHENTYLNFIHDQLFKELEPHRDQKELMEFIENITTSKKDSVKKWKGERNMIDLFQRVVKYYYSPRTHGSNSLKQILPAIIADSDYLRKKYSQPIYGKNKEVPSLNVDSHVWIDSKYNNDPYQTLKGIFDDYDPDKLDQLVENITGIADGGTAMAAYNLLQFSEIPLSQREEIKEGLLRYCELDTMAMVMLIEGWLNME